MRLIPVVASLCLFVTCSFAQVGVVVTPVTGTADVPGLDAALGSSSEHIASEANPHTTTLQQVTDAGETATRAEIGGILISNNIFWVSTVHLASLDAINGWQLGDAAGQYALKTGIRTLYAIDGVTPVYVWGSGVHDFKDVLATNFNGSLLAGANITWNPTTKQFDVDATTNEASTSDTELMTAGGIARAIAAGGGGGSTTSYKYWGGDALSWPIGLLSTCEFSNKTNDHDIVYIAFDDGPAETTDPRRLPIPPGVTTNFNFYVGGYGTVTGTVAYVLKYSFGQTAPTTITSGVFNATGNVLTNSYHKWEFSIPLPNTNAWTDLDLWWGRVATNNLGNIAGDYFVGSAILEGVQQ